MSHLRDTRAMLASLRCGARTRSGGCCKSPAVSGQERCRMHGGSDGTGAPLGNCNALRHGFFCRAAVEQRRKEGELMRQARKLLDSS
jgi:glucans biosynthesis protein